MRLTLEHSQVRHLVDARVDDLHGGAAGPDDRHPLAGEIQRRIPQRRMSAVARERFSTLDVGPPRAVEVAGGRDDDGGIADVAAPVTVHRMDLPLPAFLVPPQRLDLGAEPGVLAKPVLVGKRHQILLVLRALRVVAAPVRVHLTRQRVVRRWCVHTDAGVGGGQPSAADFGVAVEDLVAHPFLGGRQRDVDTGDAGTDDGDFHGVGNGHGARQRGL